MTGRPTDYKEEYNELAFNYCLLGATDANLAEFFNVQESTINNWKKKHPAFLESINRGKHQADATVAQSLYKRATGYTHPEVKVFNNQGEIITHEVVKHHAPDPASMFFWLKNRQPKMWRDKQDIDHTSSDGSMTPRTIGDFYADNKDD